MDKLIIIGAGGFGREILSWIEDVPGYGKQYIFSGFLDDNQDALINYNYNTSIIGTIKEHQPKQDELFVMGIASPTTKKMEIVELYEKRGGKFISLIHPTVLTGKNVSIGRGCVICPNVIFTCDINIEKFVTVNVCSAIGHDVVIGAGCTLYSFVNLNGFVRLGKGVEIGSHGSVLPKVSIGNFAKIGAGSLVVKSVKEKTTVMGVPAKKIIDN